MLLRVEPSVHARVAEARNGLYPELLLPGEFCQPVSVALRAERG